MVDRQVSLICWLSGTETSALARGAQHPTVYISVVAIVRVEYITSTFMNVTPSCLPSRLGSSGTHLDSALRHDDIHFPVPIYRGFWTHLGRTVGLVSRRQWCGMAANLDASHDNTLPVPQVFHNFLWMKRRSVPRDELPGRKFYPSGFIRLVPPITTRRGHTGP